MQNLGKYAVSHHHNIICRPDLYDQTLRWDGPQPVRRVDPTCIPLKAPDADAAASSSSSSSSDRVLDLKRMPDEECPIAAAAANITNADLKPAPFVPDLPPLVREIEEFESRESVGSSATSGSGGSGAGVGVGSAASASASGNSVSGSGSGSAGKRPNSHYVHNLYAYPLSVDFGSFSKTRNVAVRVQLRLDDEGVGSGLGGGSAGTGAGASKSRVISTVRSTPSVIWHF